MSWSGMNSGTIRHPFEYFSLKIALRLFQKILLDVSILSYELLMNKTLSPQIGSEHVDLRTCMIIVTSFSESSF